MWGSLLLNFSFFALPVAMMLVVGWLARPRLERPAYLKLVTALIVWFLVVGALALTGSLHHFSLPPPLMIVFVVELVLLGLLLRSSWGAALAQTPQAWLIGLQAFRVPVELAIHRAVTEGVAPPQMTWSGTNIDIVPAVLALPVAMLLGRLSPRADRFFIVGFHVLGLATLAGVVGTGVVSMPTPFQLMKPDNTWIAFFPYAYLPTVLVATALLLHGLSFRALVDPPPGSKDLPLSPGTG